MTVYVLQFSGRVIDVVRTGDEANKLAAACARVGLEKLGIDITDERITKLIRHEVVITTHEV